MSDDVAAWMTGNQRWLVARIAAVKARLRHAPHGAEEEKADALRTRLVAPPALDLLADRLDLSTFERDIVLLCASVQMDAEAARGVAQASPGTESSAPTFGLALALLADPHWSALTPGAPLRRLRLIEVDPSLPLTRAPLRLDERVLHYLAGLNTLDARLGPLLREVEAPELATEAQDRLADRLAGTWRRSERAPFTTTVLYGDDAEGREDVAARAADAAGRHLFVLRQEDVPRGAMELDAFRRLWEREARLLPAVLFVQCDDATPDPCIARLVERLEARVVVGTREAVGLGGGTDLHEVLRAEPGEQGALWHAALDARGTTAPANVVEPLASTFRFGARSIAAMASALDGREDPRAALRSACKARSRRRLDDLATPIVPRCGWDDLVLPEAPRRQLRAMAAQLRHRRRVHDEWGFGAPGTRGLGMAALFCGESGTGKTMAAEVLSRELDLDLYRIDLSAVVSKYIGETEKNLRRVFDAAEDSGSILLFDEADALFGKRGDVKDSHDRYANIEVGYLLTRMEAYRGLAILTTNLKSSLDAAFLRRLRFIISFPFPDEAQRERIWRRSFPPRAPVCALEFDKLARLRVPGGAIRNIALNAAFLAAEDDAPLGMPHLLQAARSECAKQERTLADAEIRGWS